MKKPLTGLQAQSKEIIRRCQILELLGDDAMCRDYDHLSHEELAERYGWVLEDEDLDREYVFKF